MPVIVDPQRARELAAKSHEARRRNKALREQAEAEPQPAEQIAEPAIDYITERLARVRKQIDMLSDMLEAEQDPNKLDRLANSISRMSELERQLAGRPLPGSLKPSPPKQSRAMPVQPMPIPQVVVAPIPGPELGTQTT